MSAAAAKRTVLAAVSIALLGAVSIAGSAGGASSAKRDRVPPSPPSNLHVAAATPSLVTAEWDPAQDDVGVAGYYVYGDTGKATVASTSYTVSSLGCGESGGVSVAAYDRAGNRSPRVTATISTAPCPDTQPPSTPSGFRQAATTQDAVVLGWNASSDDVGVVEYGVYRNLARVASVSQPSATLSGLSCGTSYAVGVDAFDAAGNRSTATTLSASTDVCPPPPPSGDTTPPTSPTGLAASSVSQTGLTLNWNPSSDNVGILGYDVYRSGTQMATVTSTFSSQTGLSCGTSYAFAVVARDVAGNSSQQAQLSASTSPCSTPPPPTGDTTPPSQPTNLGIANVTRTSVSLTWGLSTDNVGVVGYRTYVNSAPGSTSAQLSATVSSLTCGTAYTFEVDAYDAASNRSTRASVIGSTAACPDTQPPTPPANVVATSRTATSIALGWTASSDNVGVTGYGLYRGGAQMGTTSSTTGIFSGLTCNTNYTLAVDAYDAGGNHSSQTILMVSTTVCPDTTPPSVPTNLSASNVSQTGLTLTWNGSTDNVAVTGYDAYRNGTKMATVTSTSSSQTGLACGTSYTLGVVARDAAGNSSPQASLQATTSACSAPPPPPSNRYTDINFAGGKYAGQGIDAIFEAYQSDPRLSSWGGTDPPLYDQWGMSTDTNQRVHLAQFAGRLGSWQELRSTDGPWQAAAPTLAKSSINASKAATWGPGGFSMGAERWFAFDYLLPLNVNGVNFDFVNTWHCLMDLHPSDSSTGGTVDTVIRPESGNPRYHMLETTPNPHTTPYRYVQLEQLTNADGSRVASAYNTWHEVVIGIKTSDQGSVGNSPGWLEVWHDGVNVMPREQRPTVLPGETGPYAQMQNYTPYPTPFAGGATRSAIVYGGFRAGLTRADVQTR